MSSFWESGLWCRENNNYRISRVNYEIFINPNNNKSKNDNFASKPKNDYTKVEDSFKKGSLVQHKLYGKGMVLGVEGYGENTKVTVLFSGNVKKKFIQKYANLIVVK